VDTVDHNNDLDDDLEEEDDDTLIDRIMAHGEEVACQEWDSGACGAGGGVVSVYEFEGQFCVLDDCVMHGPYATEQEAVDTRQVDVINAATVIIWEKDAGVVYDKAVDGDPEEEEL
jgi:hypothetical protein